MRFGRRRIFDSPRRERTDFGGQERIEVSQRGMVTGSFERVTTTSRRKLSQYKRHHASFKIGFTGNPNNRARAYQGQYVRMEVLCKTSSRDYIKVMESDMTLDYWEYCDNSIAGGGGSVEGPPYYLYVVF